VRDFFQFDFDNYDIIFAPFNSGGHWELVVVFPPQREIVYMNPLGELENTRRKVMEAWCRFFDFRMKTSKEKKYHGGWNERIVQHTKQQDSHSCGIHIIKVRNKCIRHNRLR
jgi:Ulp1 family protease